MGFFEFRIPVKCTSATVFAVFTDTDAWLRCTEISQVEWLGKPWEEGSRIRVKHGDSRETIDQVLVHFEPPRSLAYISHFFGMTLETRLTFYAVSDSETEVQVRGEFVGIASRAFGFALGPAIERATRATTQGMAKEAERVAASQPRLDSPSESHADASRAETKPESQA